MSSCCICHFAIPRFFPPSFIVFCFGRCLLWLITVNSNQICLSLFFCVHVSVCVISMCDLQGHRQPSSTSAVHHLSSDGRSLSSCYSVLSSLLHFTPLSSNCHFLSIFLLPLTLSLPLAHVTVFQSAPPFAPPPSAHYMFALPSIYSPPPSVSCQY